MGLLLLIVFTVIPILEITIFISIGSVIGLWPTLITVVLTAIIGTALLRKQGLATLFTAQKNLGEGQFPIEQIFDGLCLIIAGFLLITPGFVTDGIGVLLFLPQFRVLLKKIISRGLVARTTTHVYTNTQNGEQTTSNNPIIDGEFEEIHSNETKENLKRLNGRMTKGKFNVR